MGKDRQNVSIDWFGLNAAQNRVHGVDNSLDTARDILQIKNSEFLPSIEENHSLLHDFIPLVARVVAKRVPAFECFGDAVVKHIPHQYSEAMKMKSVQVSKLCSRPGQ